jgi:hypothetical protein
MKWWITALIVSALWIALCFGGAFAIFPADTTPEQDVKLSEILGEVIGGGLAGVWLIVAWACGKIGPKKPRA